MFREDYEESTYYNNKLDLGYNLSFSLKQKTCMEGTRIYETETANLVDKVSIAFQ